MIDIEDLATDAEAEQKREPTNDELRQCTFLAEQILRKRREVNASKLALAKLEKDLALLEEVTLPDLMHAINLTMFKLGDGSVVEIRQDCHANIPSADSKDPALLARRDAAFAWLRDNNQGDLIKNEVRAALGRGQDAQAAALRDHLSRLGVSYTTSETVNHNTLKAWATDRLKKALDIPRDLFGVHVRNVVKIKGK